MGRKKPREIPGDDGETVVNMNVEGMPWYVPKKRTAEQEGAEHYQMTREPPGRKPFRHRRPRSGDQG